MKSNVQLQKAYEELKVCLKKNIVNPKCVDALFDTINSLNAAENIRLLHEKIDEIENDPEGCKKAPTMYSKVALADIQIAPFRNELKRRFIRDTTRFMSFWFRYVKEAEKVKPFARAIMLDKSIINWQSFYNDIYTKYNEGFTFSQSDDTMEHKLIKYMNITINAIIMTSRRKLGIDNVGHYRIDNANSEK